MKTSITIINKIDGSEDEIIDLSIIDKSDDAVKRREYAKKFFEILVN